MCDARTTVFAVDCPYSIGQAGLCPCARRSALSQRVPALGSSGPASPAAPWRGFRGDSRVYSVEDGGPVSSHQRRARQQNATLQRPEKQDAVMATTRDPTLLVWYEGDPTMRRPRLWEEHIPYHTVMQVQAHPAARNMLQVGDEVGSGSISVECRPLLGRPRAPARAPAHPVPRVRAMTDRALSASKRPDERHAPWPTDGGFPCAVGHLTCGHGSNAGPRQGFVFPRFWSLGL